MRPHDDPGASNEQIKGQREERKLQPLEDTALSTAVSPVTPLEAPRESPCSTQPASEDALGTATIAPMELHPACDGDTSTLALHAARGETTEPNESEEWRSKPTEAFTALISAATADAAPAATHAPPPVTAAAETTAPTTSSVAAKPDGKTGHSAEGQTDRDAFMQADRVRQNANSAWICPPAVTTFDAAARAVPATPSSQPWAHPTGAPDILPDVHCRSRISSRVPDAAERAYAAGGSEESGDAPVAVVYAGDEEPQKPQIMSTSHIWIIVFSVLLTWVQDPLLSLIASAAAARMEQGASLAVVAVGAGGQAPDGLCLLLAALGLAVGALCNRAVGSHHEGNISPRGKEILPGCTNTRDPPILAGALRVAAVGAWLAGTFPRLQY